MTGANLQKTRPKRQTDPDSDARSGALWPRSKPSVFNRLQERARLCLHHIGDDFRPDLDRGRLILWAPVLFGFGIVLYFSAPQEPDARVMGALALGALLVLFQTARQGYARALPIGLCLICLGFAFATLQTAWNDIRFLDRERTVSVTGFVEWADFRPVGQRVWFRVDPERSSPGVPKRIQISVRSVDHQALLAGQTISGRARLSPPSGPVMPGGYDFRRAAFFEEKGAIGFFYGRPEFVEAGANPSFLNRLSVRLAQARHGLAMRLLDSLPGRNGALAVALVTGDRGLIPPETVEALRASGLAHVLAISGMHMAIVAGTVYWALRAILAFFPGLALSRPIRKWAAFGALCSAFGYLILSGGSVATQRAFIMTGIFLVAILVDRRALTLRNMALAAICVLIIAPESLLTPGFQMSFAAAASLVATFERGGLALGQGRDTGVVCAPQGAWRRMAGGVLRWGGLLVLSSLIAGLATGIFAAYHFNRIAEFGLLTNALAMPIISLISMPSLLMGVLLIPFGYEVFPLIWAGWSFDWVIAIADWVNQLNGFGGLGQFPIATPLLAAAGLSWLCIWTNRWRWLGLAPIVVGLSLKYVHQAPDYLIAETGKLIAARQADGHYALLGLARDRFRSDQWSRGLGLEAFDPMVIRRNAAASADKTALSPSHPSIRCDDRGCVLPMPGGHYLALADSPDAAFWDCQKADVVISRFTLPETCASSFQIDKAILSELGSLALYYRDENQRPSDQRQQTHPSEADTNHRPNHDIQHLKTDLFIVKPASSQTKRPWSRGHNIQPRHP